jgi:hypothetical protein
MDAGINPEEIKMIEMEEDLPEIDLEAKLASRTVNRQHLKKWIIYPEDGYKSTWDIFMTS